MEGSIFSNHQHFAVSTGICGVACPLPASRVDKPLLSLLHCCRTRVWFEKSPPLSKSFIESGLSEVTDMAVAMTPSTPVGSKLSRLVWLGPACSFGTLASVCLGHPCDCE